VPALPSCLIEPIWEQFAALLPARHDKHPLGCHRPRISDRMVFELLINVLVFGCCTARPGRSACCRAGSGRAHSHAGSAPEVQRAPVSGADAGRRQPAPRPARSEGTDPAARAARRGRRSGSTRSVARHPAVRPGRRPPARSRSRSRCRSCCGSCTRTSGSCAYACYGTSTWTRARDRACGRACGICRCACCVSSRACRRACDWCAARQVDALVLSVASVGDDSFRWRRSPGKFRTRRKIHET
jgi:hypothetical protein